MIGVPLAHALISFKSTLNGLEKLLLNEAVTQKTVHDFLDNLEISETVRLELKQITPQNYTGIQLVK